MILELLKYFIYGWLILLLGIVVNFLAKKINLITWYDFLVFGENLAIKDVIFLFLVYPTLFGILLYFLKNSL